MGEDCGRAFWAAIADIGGIPAPPPPEEAYGIDWLVLSVRAWNVLKKIGIVDRSQIIAVGDYLLLFPHCGRRTFNDIKVAVSESTPVAELPSDWWEQLDRLKNRRRS